MKTFEKVPEKSSIEDKRETIVLLAAEMPEFKEIVKKSPVKGIALREIREILPEKFPEIKELPRNERIVEAANDFLIAKAIVNILWEK